MVTAGGKELKMSHEGTSLAELSRHFKVPKRLSQWKPPKTFKDWNDVIMNKPYVQKEEVNKFQRNKALEQREQVPAEQGSGAAQDEKLEDISHGDKA